MKISVFGNCQSQVMRSIIEFSSEMFDVPKIKLNYMVTKEDEDEIIAQFDSSDAIFVQRVSDDFGVEWARSSVLKAKFKNKLLMWPNIYFDGYYPDARYVYLNGWGKLSGPLDDYHFDSVIAAHGKGLTVQEAVETLQSGSALDQDKDHFRASLLSLQSREADVDIPISDFIEASLKTQLCFYTPNHPMTFVMVEMCRRLLAKAGIPFDLDRANTYGGKLDRIQIPFHPFIRQKYSFDFPLSDIYNGLSINAIEPFKVQLGDMTRYSLEELVASFYRVYDHAFAPQKAAP